MSDFERMQALNMAKKNEDRKAREAKKPAPEPAPETTGDIDEDLMKAWNEGAA